MSFLQPTAWNGCRFIILTKKRLMVEVRPVLIFGCLGPLIGVAALFYVILPFMEVSGGRPVQRGHFFDDFTSILFIGWVLGLLPALLTGALITRWSATSMPALLLKSAIIGAVVSLVFFGTMFGVVLFGPESINRRLLGFVAPFAVAGGIAAVLCTILSRQYLGTSDGAAADHLPS